MLVMIIFSYWLEKIIKIIFMYSYYLLHFTIYCPKLLLTPSTYLNPFLIENNCLGWFQCPQPNLAEPLFSYKFHWAGRQAKLFVLSRNMADFQTCISDSTNKTRNTYNLFQFCRPLPMASLITSLNSFIFLNYCTSRRVNGICF